MKYNKTYLISHIIFIFALLGMFQQQANATASFARSTGASCNKCHTETFPRLTEKGERFMLNGFQIKKKSDDEFGLDDDNTTMMSNRNKFKLPKLDEMLSVTGQFNPIEMNSTESTPIIGSPEVITVIAAGSLMKDMPIWAGIDISNEGASVHRYQMSLTNIADSQLFNVRMGTLDPTTWTSFYGHGAALESASSGIGSYGAGHDGNTGFVTIGSGYAERNAMEYYGYTKKLLWSLGLSNASGHDGGENDPLDYWITSRYEFMKKSTVSFLWYNANGSVENQTYTMSANVRLGKLDFLSQFSFDNTGGEILTATTSKTVRDKWGFTAQANYSATKKSMGIIRFDTTDNGEKTGSTESQLTLALVLKPKQNIKVTASYVMEVEAVGGITSITGDGHAHNHKPRPGNVNSENLNSENLSPENISSASINPRGIRSRAVDTDNEITAEESALFGDHFKVNVRYMF